MVSNTVKGNAYQPGAEIYIPYGTTNAPPLTNDPHHYWEQINHDEFGRSYLLRTKAKPAEQNYETLRKQYSEAMIAAEKAKDECSILKQENTAFQNNFNSVVRENDKLRKGITHCTEQLDALNRKVLESHDEYIKEVKLNERLQEANTGLKNQIANMSGELNVLYEANRKLTNERVESNMDKPCETAQPPEAKAYEDMHTKRMAAEIEAIELDNEYKRRGLAVEAEDSEWKAKYIDSQEQLKRVKEWAEEQHAKMLTGPISGNSFYSYTPRTTADKLDSLAAHRTGLWFVTGGVIAYEVARLIFEW